MTHVSATGVLDSQGGQRQRIAIARAIVKKPGIFILDEATSAIDVRGERIVQAALDKSAQGRTTIVIAHRLSTIKKADRIVVLKKGRVVESGSHKDLVSKDDGVYSHLVDAQALSFGETTGQSENAFGTEDFGTLSREQTKEMTMDKEDLPENDEKNLTSRSVFGSFLQLFFELKSHWNVMILGLFVSAATGTAQPMHAWMYARSISLFKWQDDLQNS